MLAFAVVTAATATRWRIWVSLIVASAAWASGALGGYLIAHRLGFGDDESPDA